MGRTVSRYKCDCDDHFVGYEIISMDYYFIFEDKSMDPQKQYPKRILYIEC